jgi:hypothetical protein
MNHSQISIPKLPFFASNVSDSTLSSTIFDAGNVIERYLLGGELGICWTPVPFLFLVVRSGKSKILYHPIINACFETQSISPILHYLASNLSMFGLKSLDLQCSSCRKRHIFSPHRSASIHEHTGEITSTDQINTLHWPIMPILTFTRTR